MTTNTPQTEFKRWKEALSCKDPLYAELSGMSEEDIVLYFSSKLEFGTAGLRGIMTAGTNAINVPVVVQATRGFAANILAESKSADPGDNAVVIAYDSRNNSELFSKSAAVALADMGIKSLIFDSPRPTPELSFAIRYHSAEFKGTVAGINITASHNPKEYNGYKAYGPDGAQISPETARGVSALIEKYDVLTPLDGSYDKYTASGMIRVIGKDTDEAYMKRVLAEAIDKKALAESGLSVVYTPLHGAGHKLVPEVLARAGLKTLTAVPEQMILDGSFPTVKSPNPENKEAFVLGTELAERINADIIVATDPDADRVGVAVRTNDGFKTLTGNRVGALLLEYIISAYKRSGGIPEGAYAVKSIVSTPLADKICESSGVKMYNVLTGFKFIGEVVEKHEKAGSGTFILGFEESYGYLKGTYARDKDAVVASMLICEMAAHYKTQNMTLADASDALDKKYGCFRELVYSANLGLAGGEEKKKSIMSALRSDPPKTIGGVRVENVRDYLTPFEPEGDNIPLPSADVLFYSLEGGGAVIVRPSGTEPKVKMYCMVSAETPEAAETKAAACRDDMKSRM
ncbi:MAG: phospho-sugar mutase [Firmicutes bacterium]|nr:phospho-sugar mutase [Bacillota bacterium]